MHYFSQSISSPIITQTNQTIYIDFKPSIILSYNSMSQVLYSLFSLRKTASKLSPSALTSTNQWFPSFSKPSPPSPRKRPNPKTPSTTSHSTSSSTTLRTNKRGKNVYDHCVSNIFLQSNR